ncbi:MAG: N-acetylmuramoyl-L-alanine amidase [bacterium LCO1.1]|uniref:N-acetylmuramoyl-L-alanine amidase n=1 Tax=Candidatus Weimeria bifida TaxID=2599074 RepID=A0A6N7J362_9FIRM|nr:N-acetylmuramoyl-L-alanine amidase [Candidatus Weimeria bifida]
MKKFLKSLCFLLTVCLLAGAVAAPASAAKKKKKNKRAGITIGIDPGHQQRGNYSKEPIGPGSRIRKARVAGGTSGRYSGIPEYKLTLSVAKKLQSELKRRGYKVVMTRTKNNVNISNAQRAKLLNKKCRVAVRLHADGAGPSARGASAQCSTKRNRYIGRLASKCQKLSSCVLNSYCKKTGRKNRGISYRDDLTGTNYSKIPVTLIEMGFMTNKSDDSYMASSKNQTKMAKGIADGIDRYFGFKK